MFHEISIDQLSEVIRGDANPGRSENAVADVQVAWRYVGSSTSASRSKASGHRKTPILPHSRGRVLIQINNPFESAACNAMAQSQVQCA